MLYKNFFIISFFFLLVNCSSIDLKDKKNKQTINNFTNKGFALVYSDKLYDEKIISNKLNERDLLIFQRNLKKNTQVKITNILNNKSIIAKVGKGRDTNNNDLVWIGQACNYASHLSGYGKDTTLITSRTYNRMNENSKFYNGKSMWSEKKLTIKNGKEIDVYESNWGFIVD